MDRCRIPVISFVAAKSGSGKTTLLEQVIKRLKAEGLRIACIKHDGHGFAMDKEGKDTWRFSQAGADIVAISSPRKVAVIEQTAKEKTLDEICAMIADVDLILTEGFKLDDKPKIEVHRSSIHDRLICKPNELLAIASDTQWDIGVPCFHINDIEGIAEQVKWYMENYAVSYQIGSL